MWWCKQRTLEEQSPWERSLVGTLGSSPTWVCGEGWTSHKVCQGWKPLWADYPGTRPQQHRGSPILSMSSIFSNLIETKTSPLSPNASQVVAWAVTWLTQQAWVLKPCTFQRNHWSLIDKLLGEPLGPWNILLGKSVFIYPRPWAMPYHVCCKVIYGKCLFLYVHLGFWVILYHFDLLGAGDWVVKVSHVGIPHLPDWPPIKTLDAKSRVSFRGWQYFTSAVPRCCWES